MADNITIKDGAGVDAVVATKDLGGAEYQAALLAFGSTPTLADAQTPFPVYQACSKYFNDTTTNQTSGANNTFAQDTGIAAGSLCPWNYYNVVVYNSHASSFKIQFSNDGTTYYDCSPTINVLAGQSQTVSVPICARYYQTNHTQGGTTSTTFCIKSSFTVN